jgi:sterol desaturase/sphingolipid hydroxylase (fatty acid hydroxylase superfamily)
VSEIEVDPTGALVLYAFGVPAVLALILIEALLCSARGWRFYRQEDTWCTLGLLAGNILVNAALKASTLAFYLYLYQFRLFDLSGQLPLWAIWVLSFVAIDLVFYWYHRMSHRSRCLWAVHMSHHSSEEMNFVVAFRQAWLGPVTKIPFFTALPLFGLDPTITLVAGVGSTLWGVVGHTQIVGKLWAPLEWLFNTPSHHRVHHGSNPQYIDKNYGNLFIIWDRLFGTFEPEGEPVRYGLRHNVETFNPVTITVMDWAAMIGKIRAADNWRDALGYCFRPPGWEPVSRPDTGARAVS